MLFDYDPEGFKLLEFDQTVYLTRFFNKVLRDRLGSAFHRPSGNGLAGYFNAYGDVVHHLDLPHQNDIPIAALPGTKKYKRDVLNRLEAWAKKQKQKGVRVVYAFPPVMLSYFALNKAQINLVHKEVLASTLQVIEAEPVELANAVFYDTVYHLTGPARRERSLRLAEDLVKAGIVPVNNNR